MRIFSPLNNRGMSLVTVLVALGIMGFVSMAIITWNSQKVKINQQINVSAVADQIKQRLLGAVLGPDSWQATQAHNSNAFAPGVDVEKLQPQLNIYLRKDDTLPYYDLSNPQAGFNLQGDPCTKFNTEVGDDTCPFRYDVRLVKRVFQNNNNWIDTIRFALVFKPASSKLIFFNNAKNENYNFELARNLDGKSIEESCIAMKGIYTQNTNSCNVQITQETRCPDGSVYKGPGEGCAAPVLAQQGCPTGVAVRGFDSAGKPICDMNYQQPAGSKN